jgi:hypothetical protein
MLGLIRAKRPIPVVISVALPIAMTLAGVDAGSNAATIPLTDVTPGTTNIYSYTTSSTANVNDPNASLSAGIKNGGGSYYLPDNTAYSFATVSYSFDVAPNSNNLNLTGANLFAPNVGGETTASVAGISLDYSLTGGNSGTGNLFHLLTLNQATSGTAIAESFNINLPLTQATTDTFVTLTFTTTAGNTTNPRNGGFQEQVLTSSAPFVATATFTPEPATLSLIGLSSLGLLGRRRRACLGRF